MNTVPKSVLQQHVETQLEALGRFLRKKYPELPEGHVEARIAEIAAART